MDIRSHSKNPRVIQISRLFLASLSAPLQSPSTNWLNIPGHRKYGSMEFLATLVPSQKSTNGNNKSFFLLQIALVIF